MIVKRGGSVTVVMKNETMSGIGFNIRVQKAVSAEKLTPTKFDLSAIYVGAVLNRNGKKHDLFHGDLKVLAIESSIDSAQLGMALENGDCVRLEPQLISGSGTESYLIPLKIDFKTILNLRNDDELLVECNMQKAFCTNAALDLVLVDGGTYVDVQPVEAVGKELYLPKIILKPLTSNDMRLDENLGNFVQSVTMINTDKTSFYAADSIIRSLTLKADKGVYIQDTYEQLVAKQIQAYDNLINASARSQNFRVYEGIELHDVRLGADLYNERIVAGKNYLAYRVYTTTPEAVELNATVEKLHAVENAAKVGIRANVGESVESLTNKKDILAKQI